MSGGATAAADHNWPGKEHRRSYADVKSPKLSQLITHKQAAGIRVIYRTVRRGRGGARSRNRQNERPIHSRIGVGRALEDATDSINFAVIAAHISLVRGVVHPR